MSLCQVATYKELMQGDKLNASNGSEREREREHIKIPLLEEVLFIKIIDKRSYDYFHVVLFQQTAL